MNGIVQAFEALHDEQHEAQHDDIQSLFREALADENIPFKDRVRVASAFGAVIVGLVMSGDAFADVTELELGDTLREITHGCWHHQQLRSEELGSTRRAPYEEVEIELLPPVVWSISYEFVKKPQRRVARDRGNIESRRCDGERSLTMNAPGSTTHIPVDNIGVRPRHSGWASDVHPHALRQVRVLARSPVVTTALADADEEDRADHQIDDPYECLEHRRTFGVTEQRVKDVTETRAPRKSPRTVFQSTWRPNRASANCCMFSTASANRPAAKTIKRMPSDTEEPAHIELRAEFEDGEGHAERHREAQGAPEQEELPVHRRRRLAVAREDDRQREDHVSNPRVRPPGRRAGRGPSAVPVDSARSLRCSKLLGQPLACTCIQNVI